MQINHSRSIKLYLIVGGTTAAIYYGLISILWGLLATNYLLAVSIAYVML